MIELYITSLTLVQGFALIGIIGFTSGFTVTWAMIK